MKHFKITHYLHVLFICVLFIAVTGGCSKKETTPTKTRVEVLEEYKMKYGIDPLTWSEETMKQFYKDMQKAKVITE